MDSTRFLIVGVNGQLSKALQLRYPNARVVGSATLDISNRESVQNYDWSTVDVILNAAAFTNVDGAESAEGRIAAWKVNAHGVAHLVEAATKYDLTLVHVSTDYVFDGTKRTHDEHENFTPLGVYGQSKAAGDLAASLTPKVYILRTSWVIGEGKNFVRTMISLADRDISPTVVADQVGRLTFTETLVDAIDHLLSVSAPFGTYNISNDGDPVSWADITRTIFTELGRDDLTVADTTTAEYFAGKEGIAPRPLQSTLELGKIKETGLVLRDWRVDLHTYISQESKE